MNEPAEKDGDRQDTANRDSAGAAQPMQTLQVAIGLLAGLAAVVYIAGGAALGLRLLFAGLPALPVGQLPREFLFSLGAAQIVVPACALGVIAGLIELGQRHESLVYGHLPWSEAKLRPALRRTYVVYYATAPFLLIAPGLLVVLISDDALTDEPGRWMPWVALGAVVAVAVGAWWLSVRDSPATDRESPLRESEPKSPRLLTGFAGSFVISAAFALWWWREADDTRYLGIVGAWAVSALFALFAVWCRAQVGARHRRNSARVLKVAEPEPEKRSEIAGIPPSPVVVVLSWAATALLVMPALVFVIAAWPLSEAVVCANPSESTTYAASGRFVGETKDRVYIGVKRSRRIISVPTSDVSRLLVGREAAHTERCNGSVNGPK
jgi:hypothetical protein